MGHACLLGKSKINSNDSLLIIYGDTLFEADLTSILGSEHIYIGVRPVENPRRFGIIKKNDDGDIISFLEKPKNPLSNLAILGIKFFPSAGDLFDSIHYIVKNDIMTKGEYQITDAFSHMTKPRGLTMKYFVIKHWYDCGTLRSILTTNHQILDKLGYHTEGVIQNSEIIEPIFIGEGTRISDSKVGPYVSLAKNSIVEESTISENIVDENTRVVKSILKNSLIGRSVQLEGVTGEFILGDDSNLKVQSLESLPCSP